MHLSEAYFILALLNAVVGETATSNQLYCFTSTAGGCYCVSSGTRKHRTQ